MARPKANPYRFQAYPGFRGRQRRKKRRPRSRESLVKQLKSIQQGLQAESSKAAKKASGGEGLLGALAIFFDETANASGATDTPLSKWKTHFRNAYSAAEKLLASALALIFSIIAALLSFFLIIRNRRPVTHLIRNRPYTQRMDQGVGREVTALLARLWHIPMLLAISASVVAVFVNGGEADAALGKAMISALLLALTLALHACF